MTRSCVALCDNGGGDGFSECLFLLLDLPNIVCVYFRLPGMGLQSGWGRHAVSIPRWALDVSRSQVRLSGSAYRLSLLLCPILNSRLFNLRALGR